MYGRPSRLILLMKYNSFEFAKSKIINTCITQTDTNYLKCFKNTRHTRVNENNENIVDYNTGVHSPFYKIALCDKELE